MGFGRGRRGCLTRVSLWLLFLVLGCGRVGQLSQADLSGAPDADSEAARLYRDLRSCGITPKLGIPACQFVETIVAPSLPRALTAPMFMRDYGSRDALIRHTQVLEVPAVVKNWASGGTLGPRAPTALVSLFLLQLFQEIEAHFSDIKLSPTDLFHGHLVRDDLHEDLLIVFHAKEYPQDLCPETVTKAQKLMAASAVFFSSDEAFKRRNLVWSSKLGRIWRLRTAAPSPLQPLILWDAPAEVLPEIMRGNSLQEHYLGETVGDINLIKTDALAAPVVFFH